MSPIINPLAIRRRTAPSVPEYSLASKLLESLVPSNFYDPARKYLPIEVLGKLITEKDVEKELEKIANDPDETIVQAYNADIRREFTKWILENARQTFAICVSLDLGARGLMESMAFFNAGGFDDNSLPLADPQRSPPNQDLFDLETWSPAKLDGFWEKQWAYLVPVFGPSKYDYNLLDNCILPFTKDSARPKIGAFGFVWKVTIHPDHQQHDKMENVSTGEFFTS